MHVNGSQGFLCRIVQKTANLFVCKSSHHPLDKATEFESGTSGAVGLSSTACLEKLADASWRL